MKTVYTNSTTATTSAKAAPEKRVILFAAIHALSPYLLAALLILSFT